MRRRNEAEEKKEEEEEGTCNMGDGGEVWGGERKVEG